MTVLVDKPPTPPVVENPRPYTAEEFSLLARTYPDLRMERTAQGEITMMPPAFSETGRKNFRIAGQLAAWVERTNTGEGFDSSAGFTLPNGAERLPDASWIARSRWEALCAQPRIV